MHKRTAIPAFGLPLRPSGRSAQAPYHHWASWPNQTTAEFGQTAGRRKMLALSDGSGTGTTIIGMGLVAPLILQAVDTNNKSVREQNIYEACMEAPDFVPVDSRSGTVRQ
jgi:hypothetical protein